MKNRTASVCTSNELKKIINLCDECSPKLFLRTLDLDLDRSDVRTLSLYVCEEVPTEESVQDLTMGQRGDDFIWRAYLGTTLIVPGTSKVRMIRADTDLGL